MKRIYLLLALTALALADTYHGVEVADPFRWLEDSKNPKVQAWSRAENVKARAYLDKIPFLGKIRSRLVELEQSTSVSYYSLAFRKGKLFALKSQPPKQQPFLVMRVGDVEKIVVDPNQLDPSGSTAIDWYVPSRDGSKIAVSLSKGGSERGDAHVFDVATGKELGDVVPHVQNGTAGGSLAWNADDTGFYYTHYPETGDTEFNQQIYFHKLGGSDNYELGQDFPRIAEIELETSEDGSTILASVANGDGGEHAFYLHDAQGWKQLTRFEDQAVAGALGPRNQVFLITHQGAPRGKVIEWPDKTIVPEREGAVEAILPLETSLLVKEQVGGPNNLLRVSLADSSTVEVPLPPVSALGEMVKLDGDQFMYQSETFGAPTAWIRDGKRTALSGPEGPLKNLEVVRELATSKDGTKVPMSIVRLKGTKLDGKNPTILWGYGGYGVNESPGYSPRRILWVEQGGVFAIANLRGGGEYGDPWHKAGNLTHKQNVFDDMYACAQRLKELGYCTTDKLALMGGSNGGLLMGAMITQHPEVAKAVAASVGIYDMLRVELDANGAFNVTEFGTVKDPAQFKALYAYSPYHHVRQGVKYPAVLFTTGANDPRVNPYHSRKMVAMLQWADPKGLFLLRTSDKAGHGMGSSLDERVALAADTYGFLFQQLGVSYR